ncbi:MAG: ABC transporter substrate-binding protein [Spirochaetes bacterium]|nr:ABC transporter substrate-binding protein [Spirochaetota bacterium]MBU0956755.1 ABC transporter substrate-binding protein [Spirochaetota bacterium]
MNKKIVLLLAVALLMAVSVFAAAEKEGAAVGTAAVSRPLVVGSADFTGDFYTGWGNSSYDVNIRTLVWGFGLMTNNSKGEVVDSILVANKTISTDLTEWKFKLVDGFTFHNGEKLTASDVKFTYDFYMNTEALKATGGTSSLHQYVDSVVADEATNTVTFKLKSVIYTTDSSVFMNVYILPQETITKGAQAAGQTVQEYVKANVSSPIGYGAYQFVEYRPSEYVKLVAFPEYKGKAPAIKEIIVRYVPSETELDQLLQGEVDLLFQQVEEAKINPAKADPNIATNNYFRHGGGTIVLHTDYEAFALTEVRQAFAYVLNRPKIIELFLGEYGLASQGPYSKNMWMMYDDNEMNMLGSAADSKFEKSLINYDILDAQGKFDEAANIAKANQLLAAAAAKTTGAYANLTGNASSGFLWKGQPLEIKITFTDFWSDTYNLIFNQAYLDKLSFKITLQGLDWPIMYGHWMGDTQEQRQYHAFVGGMSYALKSNPRESYSTDKILPWGQPSLNGPRFSGGGSITAAQWDKLLVDIESAHPVTGKNDYRRMFREYVKVMNQELPIIPVYSNNYFDLYSADLVNFNTNALWGWAQAILDANWK